MVYFAGFATAVYNLSPAPDNYTEQHATKEIVKTELNSQQFMLSLNSGLHKCVGFAKDATVQAGKFIKQKIEDRYTDS